MTPACAHEIGVTLTLVASDAGIGHPQGVRRRRITPKVLTPWDNVAVMEFRIGCSGWSYQHWKGDFYPPGMPQSRWFDYYAEQFDTVELNNSFYRLPSERAVAAWKTAAPAGFCFSVKASRFITHYRRLLNASNSVKLFFDRMDPLGDRLGPVLYQFPANFPRDDDRLEAFLALLPRKHMHVFEFRHKSWWNDDVFALLRHHRAGFCIYHMGRESTPLVATCPDAYVRFHGPTGSSQRGYSDRQLRDWAKRIGGVGGAKRAWVYFNNDVGGHAPRNAHTLKRIVERRRRR